MPSICWICLGNAWWRCKARNKRKNNRPALPVSGLVYCGMTAERHASK
jgi:hypothetical protein